VKISDWLNDKKRTVGRRAEDFLVRESIDHQRLLLYVGQIITSEMNLDVLFPLIMEQSNSIMDTQRSSVFLHDAKSHELWSLVATDVKRNEIRIPATYGIAGWVFQHRVPAIVNDSYSDPRFYREVDQKTGFHTKNILCVPLINREKACIGTLEALNKNKGDFNDGDLELMTSMSHYVTIAVENSRLYEELKSMNKAKERVIDHLSHELKTPLSLISATMERISKKLDHAQIGGLETSVALVRRNVNRLLRLQKEITDILKGSSEEKARITTLIEDALSLVEYETEIDEGQKRAVLEQVCRHLEAIYSIDDDRKERIAISACLDSICREAVKAMGQRELEIVTNFDRGIEVFMNRSVLEKVCSGILRNAIENTPDQGQFEVSAGGAGNSVTIGFRDYGVGITPENQGLIFTGFFHTLDTNYYTSKEPYQFNAGGTGADLLRAKVFSERCGFSIEFESTRCRHIPEDTQLCPGSISACRFVRGKAECLSTGGTVFSLMIPLAATGTTCVH
jgi:signal transduction histidine kinase